jgi:spoIIIJ-associated protein
MDNTELKEIIKTAIEELLAKMGFPSEVDITTLQEAEKESLYCNVQSAESSYLIGQYGVNLQSLQHIVRVIVRKKTSEKTNFVLDVNSYKKEKNESVLALAKNMAEQCLSEKRAIVLRPMSPYERRIIHLELSKNDQINTESIGEGEDRRVVIKPVDLV